MHFFHLVITCCVLRSVQITGLLIILLVIVNVVFPSLLLLSGHSFIQSSHLSFATHPLTFPLTYSVP